MSHPSLRTEPLDKLHVRGYVVDVHNRITGKHIGNLSWGSSGFFFHARSTASRAMNAARNSSSLHLDGMKEADARPFIRDNVKDPGALGPDTPYWKLPVTDILTFSIRPFHRVYYSSNTLPKELSTTE